MEKPDEKKTQFVEAEEDHLKLSLSLPSSSNISHPGSSSSSSPTHCHSSPLESSFSQTFSQTSLRLSPKHPLNLSQSPRPTQIHQNPSSPMKSETVPIPFPWATNRRAIVHSLDYLRENQILTITGDVQCKACEKIYEMEFDLEDKFTNVSNFIVMNICSMHDRAPRVWTNPTLPTCRYCGNSVRPVVSKKKRSINWLFLLLGQMLGCCTVEQLKYFCKHAVGFKTGAKDRILYLTYRGLCQQLDPTGPFNPRA